jgi:hypothetical protein
MIDIHEPELPMHLDGGAALRRQAAFNAAGRETISVYFRLSIMLECMRLSRDSLPLSPLVASTTSAPLALPVAGSNRILPLFNRNVPCT